MQLGRDFISALENLSEERGLEKDVIISTLETALSSAYKKYQPGSQEVHVKIDTETGKVIVQEKRKVVEKIKNRGAEISLEDAKNYDEDAEIGKFIMIERSPSNFGRIAAQTARQVIAQRLREAESKVMYSEFSDKVGNIITGTILKIEKDQITVKLNEKTEAFLSSKEKIPDEKYIVGASMKFYIVDVKKQSRGSKIILSRTHPGLLRKLMELEIPEIQQGIIYIENDGRSKAGDIVKVKILRIDLKRKRISLSINRARREGARTNFRRYQPVAVEEAPVEVEKAPAEATEE